METKILFHKTKSSYFRSVLKEFNFHPYVWVLSHGSFKKFYFKLVESKEQGQKPSAL